MLRAYRLCDPIYVKQEISFLFSAFGKVGFPRHVLENVHSNVQRKFFQSNHVSLSQSDISTTTCSQKPTVILPHNRFISQYVKPVFNANEFRVVNKAGNTLRSSLVRNKPPRCLDVGTAPGVYSVPCASCPSLYFGETGRGLNVRLGEHKNAVLKRDANNALYRHKIHTAERGGIDASN